MPFFVIHARTREQAVALKNRIDVAIQPASRAHGAYAAVVPDNILEDRGVQSLPAVFWVEEWPENFLILHQGSAPSIEHMRSWLKRYDLVATPEDETVRATVFGTITDHSTGLPLIGASVSLSPTPLGGGPSMVVTDWNGSYELDVIHPGSLILWFSFDATRSSCACRHILLRQGDHLQIDMQLDGRFVGEEPYDVIDGTFTGRFVRGFEASYFEPDRGTVIDRDGRAREIREAWVEFQTSGIDDESVADACYRVRWSGRLCGPGTHSSRGRDRYLMLVSDILEIREEPR
jgi:hypothetical protein